MTQTSTLEPYFRRIENLKELSPNDRSYDFYTKLFTFCKELVSEKKRAVTHQSTKTEKDRFTRNIWWATKMLLHRAEEERNSFGETREIIDKAQELLRLSEIKLRPDQQQKLNNTIADFVEKTLTDAENRMTEGFAREAMIKLSFSCKTSNGLGHNLSDEQTQRMSQLVEKILVGIHSQTQVSGILEKAATDLVAINNNGSNFKIAEDVLQVAEIATKAWKWAPDFNQETLWLTSLYEILSNKPNMGTVWLVSTVLDALSKNQIDPKDATPEVEKHFARRVVIGKTNGLLKVALLQCKPDIQAAMVEQAVHELGMGLGKGP